MVQCHKCVTLINESTYMHLYALICIFFSSVVLLAEIATICCNLDIMDQEIKIILN